MDVSAQSRANARSELFVGRDRELAELRAGLKDALGGRGRLFLISGEPGVGKTGLVEEFSAQASRLGPYVVWGHCWESGGTPAYWPIIQILRQCAKREEFAKDVETLGDGIPLLASLVPELVSRVPANQQRTGSGSGDSELGRFRLFDAVARLIKSLAAREPMLIVIDDLHDADTAALRMLSFLARALKEAPIVIVGTHREAEVERSPELSSAIAELARAGSQLPLSGLSRADSTELVRARTGFAPNQQFVETLHRATDGNPLFLNGVLQMLAAEGKLERQGDLRGEDFKLPASVRAAIRTRLEGMSGRTASIISLASVFGIEFDLELLKQITRSPVQEVLESLDEAVGLGIVGSISDSPRRYRFAHALIRDVVYQAIGSSERVQLHRRIAEGLEELYSGSIDAHLQELAHHYLEASPSGVEQKAISYATRAGRAAYAVFAYAEARESWITALTLIDKQGGSDSKRRALVLYSLGDELVSPWRQAIEYLEAALRECEKLGDEQSIAGVHLRLGSYWARPNMAMDVPRALAHIRKAEELTANHPESPASAAIPAVKAGLYHWSDAIDDGIAAICQWRKNAELTGNENAWAQSTSELGQYLIKRGQVREGVELMKRARARSDAIEDSYLGSALAAAAAEVLLDLGDPREAQTLLERELSRPRTAQSPFRRAVLHRYSSWACSWSGDLAEARRHNAEGSLLVSPVGSWPPDAYLLYFEGDWNSAGQMMKEAFDQWSARGCIRYASVFALLSAQLARTRGEYDQARESAEWVLSSARKNGNVLAEVSAAAELALILVGSGKAPNALSYIERCREILVEGEDWRGLVGLVAHAEGAVAAALGKLNEAERHFERANTVLRRYRRPWEEADVLCSWGRALMLGGEGERAENKFDAAIEIYRGMGAGQSFIDHVLAEKARATQPEPGTTRDTGNDCVFRREGEYWTLAYRGRTSRLKDARGLRYIAHLLAHPGREIRALDLSLSVDTSADGVHKSPAAEDLARSNTLASDLGDAGELLDEQAKVVYQRRLAELREELDDAREFGNRERVEQAELEIEALAHELKSAIGLRGRRRRAASATERVRIAVTRAIRLALGKISKNDPALGKLLSTTIKTGTSCCYVPDESPPISWQL
jgi:tetratricopeptide (TPR) repeat protein